MKNGYTQLISQSEATATFSREKLKHKGKLPQTADLLGTFGTLTLCLMTLKFRHTTATFRKKKKGTAALRYHLMEALKYRTHRVNIVKIHFKKAVQVRRGRLETGL